MNCRSCRWFEDASHYFDAQTPQEVAELCEIAFLASEPNEYGFCKRHAPRPHDGNDVSDVTWPLVYENEWCGEFVSRETEATDGTQAR
jgi:hypothetical protein